MTRYLAAIDPDYWPQWAKTVKLMRIDDDIGVGDTVDRLIAKLGGGMYKKMAKNLGIPCRCDQRREDWNILYPYETTTTATT